MLITVLKILKAIDENKALDADSASWLKNGLLRCIKDGELLHHALNLRNLRYHYLLSERNKHLMDALCLLDPSLSDWARAKELLTRVQRFKLGRWQNIQFNQKPPDNLSPINKSIFYALKTGVETPKSVRQIYSLLKSVD